MIPELTAAISIIGQSAKGFQTILEATSDIKRQEAVAHLQSGIIELQAKLFAAQAKYQELADIEIETKKKLIAYENWDAESARYQLKEIITGIFVYALKPEHAGGEPAHDLCPNCFQERKKSILNRPTADSDNYRCHRCKFEFDPKPAAPPINTAFLGDDSYGFGTDLS